MLLAYREFVTIVGYVVFAIAAVAALVAVVDWAVRTRKLNPFGGVARFFRRVVDPMMAPVERQLVRSGGQPASAPWWTLVVVVVAGLLLIAALRFAGDLLVQATFATSSPRAMVALLIGWTFGLLRIALIVRVIASWVRISPWSRWIRWSYVLTEWMIAPLRRVLPPLGGLDLSPLAAYFALYLMEMLVFAAF